MLFYPANTQDFWRESIFSHFLKDEQMSNRDVLWEVFCTKPGS